MSKLSEQFIRYAKIDTQSNEESTTCPSTNKQFNLAKVLKDELEEMGINKTELDENGYLFVTIPSNVSYKVPTIGFISHLDTSPDMPADNVKPIVVKKYSGKDIILNFHGGDAYFDNPLRKVLGFFLKPVVKKCLRLIAMFKH